jgi:hypothetical protein
MGSRIAMIALTTLSFAAGAAGEDRLGILREQFQADRDVVHQAKTFSKLGDALLDELHKVADAGEIPAAQAVLTEYRDDLRRIVAALRATGRDAEKQSGGFRELEMYLRKALPRLDQIILLVPFDLREPFEAQRRTVAAIDADLFHLLFPRQPAAGTQRPNGEKKPPGARP